MSASIITDYDCDSIQAATAVALLKFSNAHPELTYTKIGKECEREKQSIHDYICRKTEMAASCWLKLTAKWPELEARMLHELDEAEKAFQARQRTLPLTQPVPEERAA